MHYKDYKTLLSANNGVNIYRGCSHGCIYCDSRSKCYQMAHDFEDIEVKRNAPEQLDGELARKRRRCMIGTGAMSDPYIPLEAELQYTRRCLEAIERRGFGVAVQTKSDLISRDMELLAQINRNAKAVLQMTLTTADDALCRVVEPAVCATSRRAEMLQLARDAGISTVVWLSPLLPFINDTEENLRGVLRLCFDCGVAGIICFGAGMTLREGNREYYYSALDRSFPGMKTRYINTFGSSYECCSPRNDALMRVFRDECEAHRVMHDNGEIFAYLRDFPSHEPEQLTMI